MITDQYKPYQPVVSMVIYSWLSVCPEEMEPFKDLLSTHECLTCLRYIATMMVKVYFAIFLKFDNFNSKATFKLFEWIFGANSFVSIDKWPVSEGNIIVRLVFQTWEAIYSMLIPSIKYCHT